MPSKTSIILCTYNEAKYIENTIAELEKNIPGLEIVIVDDNSSDGTAEIIKQLNQNNKYKVVFRKKSRSLASAFVRGLTETTGDNIGWVDTNMGELAPKFTEMIEELKSNNDLILMSRFVKGGGDERIFIRSFSSKVINVVSKFFLRIQFNDFTSCIFLMKRKLLDQSELIKTGYYAEWFIEFVYVLYKKKYKLAEIAYIQKMDKNLANSKSYPNILTFMYIGSLYFSRIILAFIRN